MNNRLKLLIFSITALLCVSVASCNNDELLIDETFVKSGSYAECKNTIPIELSTFRLDSVLTTNQNLIWLGRHRKPVIGDVCSESFMRVTEPSYYDWSQQEKYDSITIHLLHTGDYQGDTMKVMEIEVRRMAQPIRFSENEYVFSNLRTFRDSTTVGSFRYIPRPHSRPRLRYRLDDTFGREIWNFIKDHNHSAAGVREKDYEYFLGGIKLMCSDANNLMAFRADSFKIVLHTHVPLMHSSKRQRVITVARDMVTSPFPALQFNRIWTENMDLPYDRLKTRYLNVNEKEGGNHAVMFEGLGYYTRINFPSLYELMSQSNYSHVVKAKLRLYPERGSYDKWNFPKTFFLSVVNKGNVVLRNVTTSDFKPVLATLHYDYYDEYNVYYEADLTYYINQVLTSGSIDENEGLVLTWNPSMLPTDYNFMVFNGNTKPKYYSYLEIYSYYYDKVDR